MKDLSSVGSQEMGEAFVHQQYRNPMDFIKDSDVRCLANLSVYFALHKRPSGNDSGTHALAGSSAEC